MRKFSVQLKSELLGFIDFVSGQKHAVLINSNLKEENLRQSNYSKQLKAAQGIFLRKHWKKNFKRIAIVL